MTLPLASRIALVTGASRGIGYATARALAKAGAHVVAVARTQGGLEELDDEIRNDGGSATLVPLNLTDFDGIARLGAALQRTPRQARHSRRQCRRRRPVLAARPYRAEAVERRDGRQRHRELSADPLHGAAAASKSDAGRAVFVTSGAANKARAYLGPYAASKAALETLVRVWANETAIDADPRQPVQSRPDPHAHARHACFPAKIR